MWAETRKAMNQTIEIRVAGKTRYVPYANVCGQTVVVTGNWLRLAALKDEEIAEAKSVEQAPLMIAQLRDSKLRADVFTFAQNVPDVTPKHTYYVEWDNWAAIPITSFEDWWKALPQESRKNVRRSAKRGVVVSIVPFEDKLVEGIQGIYNESPIRQGRPFWHFGKDFATVKREMDTYLERSEFIGAYVHDELVGFIKLCYVDRVATITQILAKNAHREARPMNALIASAVELCHKKQMSFLLYGKYVYGRHKQSPLTEFKRRNAFEEIRVPRFFVPLTRKGRLAITLGLHSRLRDRLPAPAINLLLNLRSRFFDLSVALATLTRPR